MSSFCYEHIQCPVCGDMMKGRGKNSDAALQEALGAYLTHESGGHFDVGTSDGLEAMLKHMEPLLPDVTFTLFSKK